MDTRTLYHTHTHTHTHARTHTYNVLFVFRCGYLQADLHTLIYFMIVSMTMGQMKRKKPWIIRVKWASLALCPFWRRMTIYQQRVGNNQGIKLSQDTFADETPILNQQGVLRLSDECSQQKHKIFTIYTSTPTIMLLVVRQNNTQW